MTKQAVSPGDIIISLPRSLLITTEAVLGGEVGSYIYMILLLITFRHRPWFDDETSSFTR